MMTKKKEVIMKECEQIFNYVIINEIMINNLLKKNLIINY